MGWYGGGIYSRSQMLYVGHTTISDNYATDGFGGGLYVNSGETVLANVTIPGIPPLMTGAGSRSRATASPPSRSSPPPSRETSPSSGPATPASAPADC